MYMDCEFNLDYKNDFVLMTDKQGNLTCGGFEIDKDLMGYSLNDSNIQSGGSKDIFKNFKDLGIPAGLIYHPSKPNKNTLIKYDHDSELCSETVYDKLLNLVNIEDKKKFDIKTRKKRENKKKMSRRLK